MKVMHRQQERIASIIVIVILPSLPDKSRWAADQVAFLDRQGPPESARLDILPE
jgi:hypothetical protein